MKRIKKSKADANETKEQWVDIKLKQAEDAAARGDSKTVYKLVKTLSSKATQKLPLLADGALAPAASVIL